MMGFLKCQLNSGAHERAFLSCLSSLDATSLHLYLYFCPRAIVTMSHKNQGDFENANLFCQNSGEKKYKIQVLAAIFLQRL